MYMYAGVVHLCRFYHLFPTLAESAMDTLLDLVEEENDIVREKNRFQNFDAIISIFLTLFLM